MKHFSASTIQTQHYPHIDGIRAFAVFPVVLFHILPALCPGGFVGVDVFFVISGYLITGRILRDLSTGSFSIRDFYHRRIRRIFPAYFAMILTVFIAGCALYYATPLILLSDSAAASSLFLSNIYFWKMQGGYFSPQQHSQPLLHLWSLSVEEQFYLFIPLLCAGIWKFSRRLVAPIMALLATLSLAGAIFAVMSGKQADAFYLLHFRAWELLAGSLLVMLPAPSLTNASSCRAQSKTKQLVSSGTFKVSYILNRPLLTTIGLLMLLISYALFSTNTPFPGACVLPAIIGTLILIRDGQGTWVAKLLTCRPFVLIGKISYSLYLWHWPVTVFWKYAVYDQLYIYDYAGMFLLSFVLGYLSWKFIEMPVRTSPFWTIKRTFTFAFAGIVILVPLGTAWTYFKGFPTILHPYANTSAGAPGPFTQSNLQRVVRCIDSIIGGQSGIFYASVQKKEAEVLAWGGDGESAIGKTGSPKVLLIGDSHAGSLRHGLDTVLRKKGVSGYCVSKSDDTMFDLKNPATQAALTKLGKGQQASTVILAQRWLKYLDRAGAPNNTQLMYAQLEVFALYIKSKGATLIILQDVPNYNFPLNEIVARTKIIQPRIMKKEWSLQQSEEDYRLIQGGINTRLDEICKKSGAKLIPLQLAFRENGHYIFFAMENGRPIPLYRDSDHLSLPGSLRASEFLIPFLPLRPD
jgi:peptidoglycan/LPS O-acetylase OafA/YrhL